MARSYKHNNPEQFRNHIKQNVTFDSETGCWNWNGYVMKNGYGKLRYFEVIALVHRVAYWCFKDTSFDVRHSGGGDNIVMHGCDNRKCCNPKHLSLGTQRTNIEDSSLNRNGIIINSLENRIREQGYLKKYYAKKKAQSLIPVKKINLVLKFPVTSSKK